MQGYEAPIAAPPLLPGERVLWRGQPAKLLVLRPIDAFLIPFSLLWTGLISFSFFVAETGEAPGLFRLMPVLFLLVGIYIAFGRFLWDALRLKRLRYVVTDQRVIIGWDNGGSLQSLDIRRLPALDMRQKSDGSGTLTFGADPGWGSMNGIGIWNATSATPPRFLAIGDVAKVYGLIQTEAHKPPR